MPTMTEQLEQIEDKIQVADPKPEAVATVETPKPTATRRCLVSVETYYLTREEQEIRFMDVAQGLTRHGQIIVFPAPGDKIEPVGLRWGLIRPRMETKDGLTKIVREPVVRPADRVVYTCQTCKREGKEWRDKFMGRYMDGRCGIAINGFKFKCPACKTGTAVAAIAIPTLTRKVEPTDDNVTWKDSKTVTELKAAYMAGDPGTNAVLPKIWAVYDKGRAPVSTWEAQDEADADVMDAAERFRDKGTARPLDVLPYAMARSYHMGDRPVGTGLVSLWIDTKPVIGYVDYTTLLGGGAEFRRMGWRRAYVARDSREGCLDGRLPY